MPGTHKLHAGLMIDDAPTVATVAGAIAGAEGDLAAAARVLGVGRMTLYRWVRAYPKIGAAVAAARGRPEGSPLDASPFDRQEPAKAPDRTRKPR